MRRPPQITPRWLTLEGAAIYSGLSQRTIQNYIKENLIVSANVIIPGRTRGRWLVDRESLDAFIEQFVERIFMRPTKSRAEDPVSQECRSGPVQGADGGD